VAENWLATWDGDDWSVVGEDAQPTAFQALARLADGTLVAVGPGRVATWSGTAFEDVAIDGSIGNLYDVAADGDGILAAADGGVLRGSLDDLRFEAVPDDELLRVAVAADGTAWAVGVEGAYVDRDGWSVVDAGFVPIDVAPLAHGRAVLAGDHGGPTLAVAGPDGVDVAWNAPAIDATAGWLDADGTAWLVGYGAAARLAGELTVWDADLRDVRAVDGASPTDVIGVGDGSVVAWFGGTWVTEYTDPDGLVWDVSIAPDGAAFAGAGHNASGTEDWTPQLLRRDDGIWLADPVPLPGQALIAVEAFAADDVYALTWNPGALAHWDGAAWTTLAEDLDAEELWGRSGADLYVGGRAPHALQRWDGAALVDVPGAPTEAVIDLAGDDDGLLVAGVLAWGEDYTAVATELTDGAWSEILRSETGVAVAASPGGRLILADGQAWRSSR
jgi:hypothetical protein